ncbi:MAG: DUF4430 domain-containing protein [Candidatus Heimdallarchaeota archaeon]|nr:DUF4430 domain-containing protein [Candidatus Heimdallarchaeota archaeon]
MSNFVKKHYKTLTIIGSVFILAVVVSGLIFGPFNEILPESLRKRLGYSSDPSEESLEVNLFINFNGYGENVNRSLSFLANQTATAYSILLQANLSVESKSFAQGIFIEAIEGVYQDNDHFWWYLVDGEDGTVASNRCNLREKNAKKVTWIYKSYSD